MLHNFCVCHLWFIIFISYNGHIKLIQDFQDSGVEHKHYSSFQVNDYALRDVLKPNKLQKHELWNFGGDVWMHESAACLSVPFINDVWNGDLLSTHSVHAVSDSSVRGSWLVGCQGEVRQLLWTALE